jgi:hypothetical protein
MYDSWTCVMIDKGPGVLEDDVRDSLKLSACELAVNKLDRMQMSTPVCDGVIQTEWKSHNIGSRSGILFRAQITSESGDYKVNFLLSEDDLKRGAKILRASRKQNKKSAQRWEHTTGTLPLEELYDFRDLSKRKLH